MPATPASLRPRAPAVERARKSKATIRRGIAALVGEAFDHDVRAGREAGADLVDRPPVLGRDRRGAEREEHEVVLLHREVLTAGRTLLRHGVGADHRENSPHVVQALADSERDSTFLDGRWE